MRTVRLKNFRTWIHCQSSCLPYKIISCYIKENDMKNPKIAKEYNEFLERNSFDKYSDRKKYISSPTTLQCMYWKQVEPVEIKSNQP